VLEVKRDPELPTQAQSSHRVIVPELNPARIAADLYGGKLLTVTYGGTPDRVVLHDRL
jgi:hypothetical protein